MKFFLGLSMTACIVRNVDQGKVPHRHVVLGCLGEIWLIARLKLENGNAEFLY